MAAGKGIPGLSPAGYTMSCSVLLFVIQLRMANNVLRYMELKIKLSSWKEAIKKKDFVLTCRRQRSLSAAMT